MHGRYITVHIPRNLGKLAKIVAINRGVTLMDYLQGVIGPPVVVDHTALSHGNIKIDAEIAQCIVTSRNMTTEEYREAAFQRQLELDFIADTVKAVEIMESSKNNVAV